MRLTRKNAAGNIVIDHTKFPEYSPETIWTESGSFEPIREVIQKLFEYEEKFENV